MEAGAASADAALAREFVRNGRSSLDLRRALKVANNLTVSSVAAASAHFAVGDRVVVQSAGTKLAGLVLGVAAGLAQERRLDPLRVLLVDGESLVVRDVDEVASRITLVAGVGRSAPE